MNDVWSKYITMGIPMAVYTSYDFVDEDLISIVIELTTENILDTKNKVATEYVMDPDVILDLLRGQKIIKSIIEIKNYNQFRKYLMDHKYKILDGIEYDPWFMNEINKKFMGCMSRYHVPRVKQISFDLPIWNTHRKIETPHYSIVQMIPASIDYIKNNLEIGPREWHNDMIRVLKFFGKEIFIYKFLIYYIQPEDEKDSFRYITIDSDIINFDFDGDISDDSKTLSMSKIDILYSQMMYGNAKIFKTYSDLPNSI